jgi:S-adenosylmethionine:tRNA ribosyltransferase-isomerase
VDVTEFDFDLPPDLIAQAPPAIRGASRLLVLHKATGRIDHTSVDRIPELFRPGDLLVVNDTKVFPARLLGTRVPSGGGVEFLLLGHVGEDRWDALVHPGQKLKVGSRVIFEQRGRESFSRSGREGKRLPAPLYGEVLERRFHGRRTVRLWVEGGGPVEDAIDAIGHVPLPPYIRRQDHAADKTRYQTVYARERGSVAAPTAGLHFTEEMLDVLRAGGVDVTAITLHVGYGTFRPLRVDRVEDHAVDPERFAVTQEAAAAINRAREERRRIIAVGTTTTRVLETVGRTPDRRVAAQSGSTDLFIYPGFDFRAVGGLLTNFHLPRSSLLMLVCAFAGRSAVLEAYREAIPRGYRFYSYGDAMLIL